MKLGKLYQALIMLLFFSGCATVTETELSNAKFEPLQANYMLAIKSYMGSRLKDPYSATYRFSDPRCGFSQDGFVHGGQKHFGHIVPAHINAKNSYGGFTGEKSHYFFFAEGRIKDVTHIMGQMADFVSCPNFVGTPNKEVSKNEVTNIEVKSPEGALKTIEQASAKNSEAYKLVKKPCTIGGSLVNNAYINKVRIAYKEAGYSDEASEIYIKSAFFNCLIDE